MDYSSAPPGLSDRPGVFDVQSQETLGGHVYKPKAPLTKLRLIVDVGAKTGLRSGKKQLTMALERASGGTSLIAVLDRVLDKEIVVDAWVRYLWSG